MKRNHEEQPEQHENSNKKSTNSSFSNSNNDIIYMEKAFIQAKLALEEGEVPVGCIFTLNNEIICEGRNSTNKRLTGEAHAEMKCIDEILTKYPNINWSNVTLYVTVEPCIMCAAALKILGITKIVFGCHNPRFGGMGTVLDVMKIACPCQSPDVISGVRSEDAINLLKEFYAGTNPSAPEDKVKKKKVKNTTV
jgi:tRNA-specific adenosine deaminase 2